jgi:hypothetical protein
MNPLIHQFLANSSSRNLELPDTYRPHGIHLVGGRGTGKSWFLGRTLAYQDVSRSIPTVIIDPVGKVTSFLLDKIGHSSREVQKGIWPRIRYVDMAGRDGFVIPYPLYYQLKDETRYTIANRFIEVIGRMNPQLEDAPVNGMNAIRQVARPTGILLSSLGYQITEAEDLLTNFASWERRLQMLTQPHDVMTAARYFLKDYNKPQAGAFRNKIADLVLDPINRAIFGASCWGIPWREVIDKKLCVVIDISRELNDEMTTLKMLWLFQSLIAFIKSDGSHRTEPLSIIIDELAAMYHLGDEILGRDIDSLTNVRGRNYNVWLTVAHQELYQFDETTQKSLMSIGTQMIGATSDPQSAWKYAQQFNRIDPLREKRKQKTVLSIQGGLWIDHIDVNPVEYSVQEQLVTASYEYMDISPLYFFVKMGGEDLQLMRLTEPAATINTEMVEQDKGLLMAHYGRRIEDIENEITKRLSTDTIAEYEAPMYDIPETGDDDDELLAPPRSGASR